MTAKQPVSEENSRKALVILESHKKLVWPLIKKYLKDPQYPLAFEIPNKYIDDVKFHWEVTSTYPERQGKYLRPTLLILTGEALGIDIQSLLNTSAAMQLSEDWLLIHDDIEDDSNIRRGKPALHKIYGTELAINAGDALHVIMWKLLDDNFQILGNEKSLRILEEFYRMLSRTTLGQGVEINWAKSNKLDFTDNDWFFIADGKTSYYTIAGPMRLGAIIGGVNNSQLEKLANFGQVLGRCFQLVDDLLDINSKDYRGKGQIMGNDIYESKKTLLLGHLLRTSSASDRKRIIRILQKSREKKTQKEVEWIIDKMQQCGSIDYARRIAQRLRGDALTMFESELKFLSHEPARSELKTLINFVLERNC